MMNKVLEELIRVCNDLNCTVMCFHIYDEDGIPTAVIEDSEGRLSSVFYEDGMWH